MWVIAAALLVVALWPRPKEHGGRLSDDEYEQFSENADAIGSGLSRWATKLRRCSVLLDGRELAAASDCFRQSQGGVTTDMKRGYNYARDHESQVDDGCRRSLHAYYNRLDAVYGTVTDTSEAGENLDFDALSGLADAAGSRAAAYRHARDEVLSACRPRPD